MTGGESETSISTDRHGRVEHVHGGVSWVGHADKDRLPRTFSREEAGVNVLRTTTCARSKRINMPAMSFIKSAAVVAIGCAYGVVASHYPGEFLTRAAGELNNQEDTAERTGPDSAVREMMRGNRRPKLTYNSLQVSACTTTTKPGCR